MKSLILCFILIFCSCSVFVKTESDDLFSTDQPIYLVDLKKDDLLNDFIKKEGKKCYEKSKCFEENKSFFLIPHFWVIPDFPYSNLKDSIPETIMKRLIIPVAKNRILKKYISWEVYSNFQNIQTSFHTMSSNYGLSCYNSFNGGVKSYKKDKVELEDIEYMFYINSTNGHINFLVTKKDEIFVEISQPKAWTNSIRGVFSLNEFNEMLKNEKIEITDNISLDLIK